MFAPLVAATGTGAELYLAAAVAFVALSACASAGYVFNDVMDLPHDRLHRHKRHRPIAAGRAPLLVMAGIGAALMVGGVALAFSVSAATGGLVLLYLLASLAYSLWAKRRVFADVVVLALLYTVRVLIGAAAVSILPSDWFLAFAIFIFLTLAIVKLDCSHLLNHFKKNIVYNSLMNVPNRKLENAVLAIISIGFVIWSAGFIYTSSFIAVDGKRYFCLFDDAMISMRYAWNFSHGLGLVWNQGEYVQGYTNFLMTLLMSFATLVFDKSNAVLFIQISGAGFMLAIAFLTMKISDHIFQNENRQRQSFFRALSFFCALFYYPLAYWSLMGMETGLLTMLLLSGVLSAFNYIKSKNTVFLFLVSVCLGLAYLTRNDSLISAVLVWAYITWEIFASTPKANLKSFRLLFSAISLYIMFVVGQLVFQYLYYGEMFPNTYTLKLTGMPLLERIKNGLGFITPFLTVSAFILILSSVELVFNFQKRTLLLISIIFSAIGYQVYVGGDPWRYWRIMSPSMPLLTILFISAANAIVLAVSSTQVFSAYFLRNPLFPRKYITEALVIPLILIGLLPVNKPFLKEILFLEKPYQTETNRSNVNTAIVLNQLTTSDATVGVIWAGSIPYYTGRKAIDFLGKSDKYIAQLPPDMSGAVSWSGMSSVPGHNKYDLNYSIKTLEPTYVQNVRWGTQDLSQWAKTKYVKVQYDGFRLFLLKDSPAVLWNKI